RWREHDTWTVAVAAKDRLMQIALLHVGGQTGARPAALNVANDERDLGHRRPADCFGFERDARPRAARHGEITGVRTTKRDRNRRQLVLGLHENAAIFRQLTSQNFHPGRPRRYRITGALAHGCGDEPT